MTNDDDATKDDKLVELLRQYEVPASDLFEVTKTTTCTATNSQSVGRVTKEKQLRDETMYLTDIDQLTGRYRTCPALTKQNRPRWARR